MYSKRKVGSRRNGEREHTAAVAAGAAAVCPNISLVLQRVRKRIGGRYTAAGEAATQPNHKVSVIGSMR
jgi:hypothetical protein